ncbi:MAG: ribosome silencing factor [Nitrososphaeraceae archaeon]|nr:ribosome silencing factor [Nitrososphaeraceae archaeon]
MNIKKLERTVINSLEELKANDIKILDVRQLTSITDIMIISSGTSARQIRSLAQKVIEEVKKINVQPLGSEGEDQGEWALIDLGDIVVHIMQPGIREYYQLEKLWSVDSKQYSSSL